MSLPHPCAARPQHGMVWDLQPCAHLCPGITLASAATGVLSSWAVPHACLAMAVLAPLGPRGEVLHAWPHTSSRLGCDKAGKGSGAARVGPWCHQLLQILAMAPCRMWAPREVSPCASQPPAHIYVSGEVSLQTLRLRAQAQRWGSVQPDRMQMLPTGSPTTGCTLTFAPWHLELLFFQVLPLLGVHEQQRLAQSLDSQRPLLPFLAPPVTLPSAHPRALGAAWPRSQPVGESRAPALPQTRVSPGAHWSVTKAHSPAESCWVGTGGPCSCTRWMSPRCGLCWGRAAERAAFWGWKCSCALPGAAWSSRSCAGDSAGHSRPGMAGQGSSARPCCPSQPSLASHRALPQHGGALDAQRAAALLPAAALPCGEPDQPQPRPTFADGPHGGTVPAPCCQVRGARGQGVSLRGPEQPQHRKAHRFLFFWPSPGPRGSRSLAVPRSCPHGPAASAAVSHPTSASTPSTSRP